MLLVVDDVQWADTASLTWLVYLAKRLRKARVLVLCATTPQLSYQGSMGIDPGDDDPTGGPTERRTLLRELVDSAGSSELGFRSAAAVRHMLGPQATDELVRICQQTDWEATWRWTPRLLRRCVRTLRSLSFIASIRPPRATGVSAPCSGGGWACLPVRRRRHGSWSTR